MSSLNAYNSKDQISWAQCQLNALKIKGVPGSKGVYSAHKNPADNGAYTNSENEGQ